MADEILGEELDQKEELFVGTLTDEVEEQSTEALDITIRLVRIARDRL